MNTGEVSSSPFSTGRKDWAYFCKTALEEGFGEVWRVLSGAFQRPAWVLGGACKGLRRAQKKPPKGLVVALNGANGFQDSAASRRSSADGVHGSSSVDSCGLAAGFSAA